VKNKTFNTKEIIASITNHVLVILLSDFFVFVVDDELVETSLEVISFCFSLSLCLSSDFSPSEVFMDFDKFKTPL
jgi:hypothetical protein